MPANHSAVATLLGLLGVVTDLNAMAGLSSPVAPSCAALAMVRPSLPARECRTTPPEVLREAGVLRVTTQGQLPRTSCGALRAKLWAAEAPADRAADLIEAINARPDTVTERQRGEAAVVIAAAKQRAIDTGLEIGTRVFDVTGARATANTVGLDIFWRNIRTHSLHDPLAHKRAEVGRYALLDEVPEPTWYT